MRPGDRLGNYEIIAPLGAGGMGEVYRAHDPKLKRDIAIKVLPAELAGDSERRQRFEREAVAVAALDHPNIVTLYSVEEADGRLFITMQLVEGKTLAELIPPHGLPLDEFFGLAVPLADAISAAHERGITHRDLKPANVMVASDGRVRVLDFGLAKLVAADPDTDPDAATHLAIGHVTEEGKILGTVAYMSPEQAEGRAIDHRSDVFSLGILMYEMITGEVPFVGDTKLSVMSSIVKDTPKSVTEINPRVPRHLGRIIRQALEKDVSRRHQTARDLRNQLQDLQREVASGEVLPVEAVAGAGRPRAGRMGLVAGALSVGALLVALAIAFGGVLEWGRVEETAFVPGATERVTRDDGMEVFTSISPDGDLVAYTKFSPENQWRIYVQQSGPGSRAFTITETGLDFEGLPQWSLDGTEIAFISSDGSAYVVPALGGTARAMVRPDEGYSRVVAIAWSPDGSQIAYAATGEGGVDAILVQPADRSEPPRQIAGAVQVSLLTWSPSGSHIAYAAENRDFFFTGNKGRSSIRVASVAEGGAVVVVDDGSMNQSPVWTPDGRHLLFVSDRDGGLDVYQVELAADGSAAGEPQAVTRGGNIQWISLSRDGTKLAYSEYRKTQNLWSVRLPQGRPGSLDDAVQLTHGDQEIESVDVSRDGTLLLYDSDAAGNQDIYSLSLVDGTERQLTTHAADEFAARWSPDAGRIVFHSFRTGKREVFVMDVDGGVAPKQLTNGPLTWDWLPAWSPDGRQIAFASDRRGDTLLIFTMAADVSELEGAVPQPLTDSFSVGPTFSPDGEWLAFNTDTELWVMRPDGSEKRVLQRGQHVFGPYWATNSREVLIALRDRPTRRDGIWAVPVDGGEPRLVVPIVNDRTFQSLHFAVHQDDLYFSYGQFEGDVRVMELTATRR